MEIGQKINNKVVNFANPYNEPWVCTAVCFYMDKQIWNKIHTSDIVILQSQQNKKH